MSKKISLSRRLLEGVFVGFGMAFGFLISVIVIQTLINTQMLGN